MVSISSVLSEENMYVLRDIYQGCPQPGSVDLVFRDNAVDIVLGAINAEIVSLTQKYS